MPADIKLLIDEDTDLALAGALRSRGYEAVHAWQAERRGLDDLLQLAFAVQQGRCFLTFNVGELVVLHGQFIRARRKHFGHRRFGPKTRRQIVA